MRIFRFLLGLFLFLLSYSVVARADDDTPGAGCLAEIERICANRTDDLEGCLADRAKSFSSSCHDQLQAAIRMASDPNGIGACLSDVKRLCSGLSLEATEQCITSKQSQFSEACRRQLSSSTSN